MILPKKKPEKTEENTVDNRSILQKIAAKFSGGPEGKDRRTQFQSYMSMIDRLQKQKFYFRNQVRARNPGEQILPKTNRLNYAR